MTALADFEEYVQRRYAPQQWAPTSRSQVTTVQGRMMDLWTISGPVGVAPTTAVVPTAATVGAVPFFNSAGSEQTWCLGGNFASNGSPMLILCDRLSHQGSLSGSTTGVVTTNLPTAALTRYTSGEGVMAGLSVYTAVGATATTITAVYTNQAGTGSQVTPLTAFGGTNNLNQNRFIPLPLASGDTGVRAVASTEIAASTTTAGNFGVVLYKPLMAFSVEKFGQHQEYSIVDGGMVGGIPEILDDACLFWMLICPQSSSSLVGDLAFASV